MAEQLSSIDAVLNEHIPAEKLAEVKRILYGNPTEFVLLRRTRMTVMMIGRVMHMLMI